MNDQNRLQISVFTFSFHIPCGPKWLTEIWPVWLAWHRKKIGLWTQRSLVHNLLNRRGKSRQNFTGTKKAILLATGLFVYCCILVKCADIKRCLRGDCSEEDEDDDEKSLAWNNKQRFCNELSVFNSAKDAKLQRWLIHNESYRPFLFIHILFFFNIWFLSFCDPSNL